MKNSKRKSMNRLYARDSKERTGPKSVFTLLTVQCSSLPGLRIGEDGLWSRGGATVVSVGPEAKTHYTGICSSFFRLLFFALLFFVLKK